MRHEHSLDALNFFLADVRQGLGPYLAIYLLTERHWAEDQIGFVMTIATVCGLIVQTPAGALTDLSHAKRAIVVTAALVVTGASILLPFMSSFVLVAGSQAATDAAAAFFGPAIAAGVALGRPPGLRIDRAGIALLGASLMIGLGSLSLSEALKAIDLDAIAIAHFRFFRTCGPFRPASRPFGAGAFGRDRHRHRVFLRLSRE
jgi:MFS family permease